MENSLNKKRIFDEIKYIVFIIAGLAVEAFGVAAFVLPNHLLIGGVTGIGRVINHYIGVNVSLAVGIASVILLIAAWIFMGTKFAMSIILGTFFFPFFLDVFQRIPAISHLTSNGIMAACFGGGIAGIGAAFIIRVGATSGGSDVIPIILNKKLGLKIAPLIYITDTLIVLAQCTFATSEEILLGIVLCIVFSISINKILILGSSDVQFMIISPKFDEINKALQEEVVVGTSLIHTTTGHLGEDIKIILCIVPSRMVVNVRAKVLSIDDKAFMTMINVNDVKGRGFSIERSL